MAAIPSANEHETGDAQAGHSDLGIDCSSRGTTPPTDLEEEAESEAGNESSSSDVYETDEDGTDFGDGVIVDPGATQKTMRRVLREIPESSEEEEPGKKADAKSTAGEASGAEAEQTGSPASTPGEPIQLPDPTDQFSLGSTDGESTPQSQIDSASGEQSTMRLTRSSSLTKGGSFTLWEQEIDRLFKQVRAQVDLNVPRSVLESTERGFGVDLPMIMRIIGSSAHPEKASASAIHIWLREKAEWNLGTEQSLYEKFNPEHHKVSTLHQAMILRKLGSSIAAILRDWAGGKKGPATMRTLHFPRFWPMQAPLQVQQEEQDAETTREWARCVANEAEAHSQAGRRAKNKMHLPAGRVWIPEPTLTALKRYTIEPTQVQQPTPPPQSPSPRKGPSENPRDLTLVRSWYMEATSELQFSGTAGHSQVSFSTNPSNLLRLVGSKAGTAGLARTEEVMATSVRGCRLCMNATWNATSRQTSTGPSPFSMRTV